MRKFLGLVLCVILVSFISQINAQTIPLTEEITQPKKQFGAGNSDTKPKSVKSFGSGDKPKPRDEPKPPVKSFGSGSKPVDVPHSTPPKTGPPKSFGSGSNPKTPVKSFGSGSNPDSSKPKADVGSKPKGNFDHKAAIDQRKVESKAAFKKGSEPAPHYTDPKGRVVQIDPRDAKIAHLRNQLNEEKWHNRDLRERNFYATYYSRPVVVYHDPYNSFFWYWLLDRSIEQQALWAYHHRHSMDSARYNDLLNRNAELAARVRVLEGSGVARNPAYEPAGIADADLMYQKDYVQAAYNPQTHHETVDASGVLVVLLYIFLGLGIVALVVWLVFVKKW